MDRHCDELKKVVLTADDVKNITEFFDHFKIEMPATLAACITQFKADPAKFTFEDQKRIRAYLAHAVTTVDHPLIKDNVFANIRTKCDRAYYEAQFDLDLEVILKEPKVAESK
jgi:hypothetical protein